MKKLVSLMMAAFLAVGLVSTASFADAKKGQKLILKKFKKPLGMNGTKFATMHTQAEWAKLFGADKPGGKVGDITPFIEAFGSKSEKLKKYISKDKFKNKNAQHVYDFVHKYAKDSGEVPSC
jgi:Spy/CpxP family protein refolding chaperone